MPDRQASALEALADEAYDVFHRLRAAGRGEVARAGGRTRSSRGLFLVAVTAGH
jgi:hypothetical protein